MIDCFRKTEKNGILSTRPVLDARQFARFCSDDAFYSVLRRRVTDYLRRVGCDDGGPTWACVCYFWFVFLLWMVRWWMTLQTGSFFAAVITGVVRTVLCAFGHNWVHQPKYKNRRWAALSLDIAGYSSEGWYRDHVLQHHMYTNTRWDHNVVGTEPFLVLDPTMKRNYWQRCVAPYTLHPILAFATYFN